MTMMRNEDVMAAIFMELREGGRLYRSLGWGGHTSDLAKYLEEKDQQGYPGDLSFDVYTPYTSEKYLKDEKYRKPQRELIRHMFYIHPGKAMQALVNSNLGAVSTLHLVYRSPYEGVDGFMRNAIKENPRIAQLLLAENEVSDYMWKKGLELPVEEGAEKKVRTILGRLLDNGTWWVRVYAASVLFHDPELMNPMMREKLSQDDDPTVKWFYELQEGGEE
jgi:hypothetical protein